MDFIFITRTGIEGRSRRQIPRRGLIEHDIATYASLFGSGVITLITLPFVRIAVITLLGFRKPFPPFLLWHMHICNGTFRNTADVPTLSLRSDFGCRPWSLRFGPIELGHALFLQHCPCRFHNRPILPFGYAILLRHILATEFGPNSYLL